MADSTTAAAFDSRFDAVRAAGGETYATFLRAGYREWWSHVDHEQGRTPYHLGKMIRAGNRRLFQIVIKVYDFRPYRPGPLGFSATVQFNTSGPGPTFDVNLLDAARGPDAVEFFFMKIYDKLACDPYDRDEEV